MADFTRYVNTASSGGDGTTNNTSGATAAYASIKDAADAAITVASGDTYTILCTGGEDLLTAVADFTQWTMNGTGYQLTIEPNTGQGHNNKFDSSKYHIKSTTLGIDYVEIGPKQRIRHIQFEMAGTFSIGLTTAIRNGDNNPGILGVGKALIQISGTPGS